MNRVLLIEDNVELAAGIEYNLVQEGMEVRTAETGEDGLELIETWRPTVVILDLMLPGMDGFAVLDDLRRRGDRTPVLILSARAQEADLIRGFRLDADQYMTKPFGLLELIERVKSLLRRGALAETKVIRFGDVELDSTAHTVTRAGRPVSLTPQEFKLLFALAQKQGRAVSRLELLRQVWGHRGVVMTRTVDAHVKELRRKLEADPAEPRHIITVWKVGYRFEP